MQPPNKANEKYKKAPMAPRRFKTAYMFFSIEKQKEIRGNTKEKLDTTKVAKMVSQYWKSLSPEGRAVWEELSQLDKQRYQMEKANYQGPWKVPAKDPFAPKLKRPGSAYLEFSNRRRATIYKENPQATSAEISAILSQQWRDAPDDVKREYMERQSQRREKYKQDASARREHVKTTSGSRESPPIQEDDSSLLFAQNQSNNQAETATFMAEHHDCKWPAVPGTSSSRGDEHNLSQKAKGPPAFSSYSQDGFNPLTTALQHQCLSWPMTITSHSLTQHSTLCVDTASIITADPRTSHGPMSALQQPHQRHQPQPHQHRMPFPSLNHVPTTTSMNNKTSSAHQLLPHNQQRLQFDNTAIPSFPSQEETSAAPLAPLTATDKGSFLAAAAALDAPYAQDACSHMANNTGFHATTTTASTVPMPISVRNVVARLPTELLPYPSQTTTFNNNDNNSNFSVSWWGSESDDFDSDQGDTIR